MLETKYRFIVQTSNIGSLNIPLIEGNALFVLGANGVGKSTLMHNLFQQNLNHTKRILAHRQTWFSNNSMDMTASQKTEQEKNIKNRDQNINSRWQDVYAQARSSISIFDLINSENIRARKITNAVDSDDISTAKLLSNIQAPLQAINELLAISNIPIVITLGKDEQLFASKNESLPYSIAELSDGERNALLICADVLTTEPNHLIILDEPERHLHRSIISPLLSSLFQKRKDCVFVISTHDVYLPIDHAEASVLLLRSCQWNGKNIKDWDADLISKADEIPNTIKREILGAKRSILFVEGNYDSLDGQIYQLIYPNVTVMPQGSCGKVEKAVEGIKGTESLHWINAYGLIDADDRTPEQLTKLLEKGVVAINCYSVESLYYNLEIVKRIAKRYAEVIGANENELYTKATSDIISDIEPHKERLCSRLCEKQVRNSIMKVLPKHKDISKRGEFDYKINLAEVIEKEESIFDKLVSDKDLNALIIRYPIRETPILTKIAAGLGLSREKYESAVRKLIIDNIETKNFFKSLLQPLTDLIEG
ncbi:AAA family ATPase [Rufibacter sediminis]|uniref:ATP-binding cassette domain-containing protein n=1 Tax=Rufibacter sediminis TaxID=2762756 RepID=A0ABR6VSL1_9BACT|nr:AAA family ATPase [Rufibacter sediminis]MBC3540169.1 ATP-binding cassette domain-containing protein [Rufibacter sediminis]